MSSYRSQIMRQWHLPPELAAISRLDANSMVPVSLRLDAFTLEGVEELRKRLNGPSRGALLRYLVSAGVDATFEKLSELESRYGKLDLSGGPASTAAEG